MKLANLSSLLATQVTHCNNPLMAVALHSGVKTNEVNSFDSNCSNCQVSVNQLHHGFQLNIEIQGQAEETRE